MIKRFTISLVLSATLAIFIGCGETSRTEEAATERPTAVAEQSTEGDEMAVWFETTGEIETTVNDASVNARVNGQGQLSIVMRSLPYVATVQFPVEAATGENIPIAPDAGFEQGMANASFSYDEQFGEAEGYEGRYGQVESGSITITETTRDTVTGTFEFTVSANADEGNPTVTVRGGFENIERPVQ